MAAAPRFILRQLWDGYHWVCPACGYSQEKAMVVRDNHDEPQHMRAGFRADGLIASVLGWCRNCMRINVGDGE